MTLSSLHPQIQAQIVRIVDQATSGGRTIVGFGLYPFEVRKGTLARLDHYGAEHEMRGRDLVVTGVVA